MKSFYCNKNQKSLIENKQFTFYFAIQQKQQDTLWLEVMITLNEVTLISYPGSIFVKAI